MKKGQASLIGFVLILGLLFTSCSILPQFRKASFSGEAVPDGPVLITGQFDYTNEFVVETYYVEHAVGLLDLTGFVLRDQEWELPVESQVLGYMDLDMDNNRATFRLALPAVPEGQFNDVDQNGRPDRGVQIFVVGYNPNLTGDIFSVGDDRSLGWPGYLASVTTDRDNQDEVTGGKLVIWAPDSKQEFPSGFGDDGLLFTQDDPVMSVPAGYSIIDLDTNPFSVIRTQTVEMILHEPEDLVIKDYSKMSYTQAFESMFDVFRKEYAFNGIAGKQPDWDAVYAELAPRVRAAEDARDPYAYYLALRDLMLKFEDGHVGLNGGSMAGLYNEENILGGWGFAVRELDDGRVIAVAVIPGMPAAGTGMRVGAEILRINGQPVQQAIENVKPFQPQSTDFGLRKERTDFLTRGGIGETITVEFQNSGFPIQNVEMTAIYELDSLFAVYRGGEDDGLKLPTEYRMHPGSNVGVITIHSNYDDLSLLLRIFERALRDFEGAGVTGIVIDMRKNSGGAPLGLAGYLHDEDIPLGQLEYYSDRTGKFEPDGPRDKVFPNENQYRFAKMVLLVDQYCYSACEIEAYGFSQVPGMVVMGQFPSAGVEAEVARGKFLLPEGMEFNIPTGRFTLPDGSIFLEGEGVQLNIRIPVDEDSVLSERDVVLEEAVAYIMGG
jgi:C-terminal processing protease CtpA/Prc